MVWVHCVGCLEGNVQSNSRLSKNTNMGSRGPKRPCFRDSFRRCSRTSEKQRKKFSELWPKLLRTLDQGSQNPGPKFSEPWTKVLRTLEQNSQEPYYAVKHVLFDEERSSQNLWPKFSEPWTKVLRTLDQTSQNSRTKFSELWTKLLRRYAVYF